MKVIMERHPLSSLYTHRNECDEFNEEREKMRGNSKMMTRGEDASWRQTPQ